MEPVAILELKKWGGHCGAKEKVGGANINVIFHGYRTYVNQMNLNGKLRKNWGGQTGGQAKIWGAMTPRLPP